jgi:hypothetical protein
MGPEAPLDPYHIRSLLPSLLEYSTEISRLRPRLFLEEMEVQIRGQRHRGMPEERSDFVERVPGGRGQASCRVAEVVDVRWLNLSVTGWPSNTQTNAGGLEHTAPESVLAQLGAPQASENVAAGVEFAVRELGAKPFEMHREFGAEGLGQIDRPRSCQLAGALLVGAAGFEPATSAL